MNLNRKRCRKYCVAAAPTALYSAGAWAAAPAPGDSAQAKAVVRARIAALKGRLGDELKKRDALRARLRDAELVITENRRRLDTLRAAEIAAERRRSELHGEQLATQEELRRGPRWRRTRGRRT
jgi:hypothetical protein